MARVRTPAEVKAALRHKERVTYIRRAFTSEQIAAAIRALRQYQPEGGLRNKVEYDRAHKVWRLLEEAGDG